MDWPQNSALEGAMPLHLYDKVNKLNIPTDVLLVFEIWADDKAPLIYQYCLIDGVESVLWYLSPVADGIFTSF